MAQRRRKRADLRHFNADTLQCDFVRIFWGDKAEKARQQVRFVVASGRRYQLALCGRGFGKSWCLALKCLWLALINPGVDGAILGRTYQEAKSGPLLTNLLAHLETFAQVTGIDLVASFNKGEKCLTLTNGSRIHIRGFETMAKLRSLSLGWAVADELDWSQSVAADVFDSLQKLIREPCPMPCLALGTSPAGISGIGGLFLSRLNGNDPVEAARYFVITGTAEDNPHLAGTDYLDTIRRGSSKRSWMQEGLGQVLTASEAVFPEFDLAKHRIPWTWDKSLDYLVGVDWGTSAASALFVQVQKDGTWIVADEIRAVEGSYQQFRDALSRKVRSIGYLPSLLAADKAVKSENAWAREHFTAKCWVATLDGGAEQELVYGLECLRALLDPAADDEPPRLLFADSLAYDPHDPNPGIVGSLLSYSYMRGRNGVLTNIPIKSATDPYKHAVDALRYPIVATAKKPQFHGGRALPFAAAASRIDFKASYEPKEFAA